VGEEPNITYGLPRDRAAMAHERILDDTGYRPSFNLLHAAGDYAAWFSGSKGAAA
jgi:hypothetical protein